MNFKSFYFQFDRTLQTPIKRVLDSEDFTPGSFIIIERDERIYLSQIKTVDHRKHSLNVSLLSPPLPCMTFSTSKSPSITIRLIDVLGCLVDPTTMTRMKTLVLTAEQLASTQVEQYGQYAARHTPWSMYLSQDLGSLQFFKST